MATGAFGKRIGRLTAIFLAIGLSTGCASVPTGFLLATPETSARATKVDMLVITTRKPSTEPGVVYSGERQPDEGSSAAEIVISVPPSHKVGQIEWAKKEPPDPAKEFATISVKTSDQANTLDWFARNGGDHDRLLVFVHGFNTRFESAVYRFAQIVVDSKADAAPVLFTWPSRGRIFDYAYDRDSAIYSRDALEAGLTRAVDAPEVKEIIVLAHSMGTYLTMEALRQLAIRKGGVPPKITNVVLASPDIDPMVFGRQYKALGENPPHLTIFVSRDDKALRFSRLLAGNLMRLGAINPAEEPYRSKLEATGNISVIDLTAVKGGDSLNHGKFAAAPEVVQLLGNQLINGQKLPGN